MNRPKLLSGNPRLDHYLLAIYVAGLAATLAGLLAGGVRVTTDLILFTVYAVAAAPYIVNLGSNAFLSTAFPFILASAISQGPGAAVVTAIAGGLSLGIARKKPMVAFKIAFNVCNYILGGVTAALVYRALGGTPRTLDSETSLRAFLGATLGYYLINTLMVTAAVAMEKGLPLMSLWVEKFHWTAYSFLAGGSFALLVILFLQKAGIYSFIIVFPFCALIYHSWKAYVVATGLNTSAGAPADASKPTTHSRAESLPRGEAGLF